MINIAQKFHRVADRSRFYFDVRDGTVEQHLSNGDVEVIPPSNCNGKSVSNLLIASREEGPQHKMVIGQSRHGKSASHITKKSGPSGKAGSPLLAWLLSRR